MLSNSEHCDVSFHCSDGVEIPAHRSVLAVACPYFSAAFRGPWREMSGKSWVTDHNSKVMLVVLTYIYTGRLEWNDADAVDVWAAASEYQIDGLMRFCELYCEGKLDLSNIISMLRLTRLYGATNLKTKCFAFVKENFVAIFTNTTGIMSVATDDPELWTELVQAVAPSPIKNSACTAVTFRQPPQVRNAIPVDFMFNLYYHEN
jgi:hypothetical protein